MNVLAIGAHPSDIELGCRGALRAHRDRGDTVYLLVMGTGGQESAAAEQKAALALGADLMWAGFEDGAVPDGQAAIEVVQAAVIRCGAAVVYTHVPRDTDPDRRATAAATLAACRGVARVRVYESATSLGFQHRLCRQRPMKSSLRSRSIR